MSIYILQMDDLGVPPFQETSISPVLDAPPGAAFSGGPWRLHTDVLEAFAAADDFAHGTAGLLQVLQTGIFGAVGGKTKKRENKGGVNVIPHVVTSTVVFLL